MIKKNNESSNEEKLFATELKRLEGTRLIKLDELKNIKSNSTGSIQLDYDLVVPIPGGMIVEVIGDSGSGKSTLCLEIAGQALKAGKHVLYENMERSINASLLRSIRSLRSLVITNDNIANEKFNLLEAANGEEALEAARIFATQFQEGVVIIDSVDALVPAAELAGEIGDKTMGSKARLISDAMRKLVNAAADNHVTLIFTNQYRSKIGMVFGDPRFTSGGDALKYYCSQRIELKPPSKAEIIKDDETEPIGHWIRYRIIKNRFSPSGREGQFPLLYYNGIYRELELVKLCLDFGILSMGGRGGKQVLLPVLKEDGTLEEEPLALAAAKAAKRLAIDPPLYNFLHLKLLNFIGSVSTTEYEV